MTTNTTAQPTIAEIDAEPAGRRLDAWVHEHVVESNGFVDLDNQGHGRKAENERMGRKP